LTTHSKTEGNRQDSDTGKSSSDGGIGFSISKLIIALLAILLVIIALLWVRNGTIPALSDEITLDEAHVHGAVSSVGAQLDGRISDMHVELGDRVEAGDILATLQNDALKAQVEAATQDIQQRRLELDRAELADRIATQQAEATLERALSEVEASEARLNAAHAEKDLRQSELERVEELATRGIAPDADLETARQAAQAARALAERRQAELEVTRAEVGMARTRLERAALRAADRDIMRKQIAEAEANLERLKARVAYSRIRAFESGVVVALPARLGDSVVEGDPILDIWRTDQIWIRAWISEDDLSHIAQGDRAKVRISAIGDAPLDGTVHRILVSRDGKASTLPGEPISPLLPDDARFAVQVLLDSDDMAGQRLLPGMSAEVRIPLSE